MLPGSLRSNIRQLFCAVLLVGAQAIVTVAQTPKFVLQSDKQVVGIGESFMVKVVMENMDGEDISFPDVSGFRVVQGPMQSSQFSLINGKRSVVKSLQYVLLATREGRYTIPPATLRIGSRILRSNALSITVKQSTAGGNHSPDDSQSGQETFIAVEFSSESGWTGQQLIRDVVLYTREEVTSYDILSDPKHDAFFYQPVSGFQGQAKEVSIGGKQYVAYILKRDRVYAKKAGNFTLEPVEVRLTYSEGGGGFFFGDDQTKVVASRKKSLVINDLPTPAPPGFSGAVGDFTLDASVWKASPGAVDMCRVTVTVEGNGDPKVWNMPVFSFAAPLSTYEAGLPREEVLPSDREEFVRKVMDVTITSGRDTTLNLVPRFVYFSPEKGAYVTLEKELGSVQLTAVSPSKAPEIKAPVPVVSREVQYDDLLHQRNQWWGTARLYAVFILLLVCIPVIIGFSYGKKKMRAVRTTSGAGKEARSVSHLRQLELYASKGDTDAFFKEVLEFCRYFLNTRYAIQLEDSRAVLGDILTERGVEANTVQRITELIGACEMARYGGYTFSVQDVLAMVKELPVQK